MQSNRENEPLLPLQRASNHKKLFSAINTLQQYERNKKFVSPQWIDLLGVLGIGAIVLSALVRQQTLNSINANEASEYFNFSMVPFGSDTSYGICGDAFPLTDVCDASSINNISTNWMAYACYQAAGDICFYWSNNSFMPAGMIFLLILSAGAILVTLSMHLHQWLDSRKVRAFSDLPTTTHEQIKSVAITYNLQFPHYRQLHACLDSLIAIRDKIQRDSRRRAFLSASLPKYSHTPLHRFFKGDGTPLDQGGLNKIADKAIVLKILDHAQLRK